jgi:hypothetical protein
MKDDGRAFAFIPNAHVPMKGSVRMRGMGWLFEIIPLAGGSRRGFVDGFASRRI